MSKIFEGVNEILPLSFLEKKLAKEIPLVVKLGVDPTAPNIHLGHIVVLEKLRDFQLLGHNVVFLIGSFTAKIGDPTGKSKTRPPLDEVQIKNNISTYINQVSRILDINKMKIVYNSDWFNIFSSQEWIKLCSKVTVAQIIQREDFANRLENNIPIGLHELLYPLLQGYDSIVLKADVEIGGTDQTFNMLMGRHLQEAYELDGQVIITMPIIEGLDGVQKMSKSLQNDISLMETAQNAFLKIMSINDNLMIKYYTVLLRYKKEEIDYIVNENSLIEAKKILAKEIIGKYWSKDEAQSAYLYFTQVIQNKLYIKESLEKLILDKDRQYNILDLIILGNNKLSRSKARILLLSGAISINEQKIIDEKWIYIEDKSENILKIGKQLLFLLVYSEK
jgi:tyrosyl-tRNA synthetase